MEYWINSTLYHCTMRVNGYLGIHELFLVPDNGLLKLCVKTGQDWFQRITIGTDVFASLTLLAREAREAAVRSRWVLQDGEHHKMIRDL